MDMARQRQRTYAPSIAGFLRDHARVIARHTLLTQPFMSMFMVAMLVLGTGLNMIRAGNVYDNGKGWGLVARIISETALGWWLMIGGLVLLMSWWNLALWYEATVTGKRRYPKTDVVCLLSSIVWAFGGGILTLIGLSFILSNPLSNGLIIFGLIGGAQAQWICWRIRRLYAQQVGRMTREQAEERP